MFFGRRVLLSVFAFSVCYSVGKNFLLAAFSKRKRDTDVLECSKAVQEATALDKSIGRHKVFISHRGLEMKRKFANHLYEDLKQRGITAFLDMAELPKGSDVRDFMPEAARKGIIGVPIFTEDYATSSWCLRELDQMMSSRTAKVIPVFYDVKSEDLRNKNGPFAEAIKAYRKEKKYDEETINGWEHALTGASWLEGFRLESYNYFEGALRKDLVAEIVNIEREMRRRDFVEEEEELDVPVRLVETRVNDVVDRFHLHEETTVYFVLLWGMAGIGKTTLANAIYQRLRKDFQAASFVLKCGEKTSIQILDRLLHDLLLDKIRQGDDVGEGRARLKRGLREKKVLIILDDMKSLAYIKEVVDLRSLHTGSRILVTSRDRGVFPPEEWLSDAFKSDFYEVPPMGGDESLRLFCLHAFQQPSPEPAFKEHARTLVQACNGLPLSLVVLGRHLSEQEKKKLKKKKLWDEAIDMLTNNKYKDISDRLMSSYKSLNDDKQEMFLDVACFLIGEHKLSAKYFWDGCQVVGPRNGLKRLIELCMVKLGEDKCLTMHDHLRYLGRDVVKKTGEKSGKWSRLWNDDDLSRVLKWKQGLDQIRGIATSLPKLKTCLLSEMQSLRLLFLDGTDLDGDREGLTRLEIKWLKWSNCPCETLPQELLDPESLTVMAVESNSDLCSNLWNTDIQILSQLREVSITTNMAKHPDFIGKMTERRWKEVVSSESRDAEGKGKRTVRLKKLKENPEERERNGCTLNGSWNGVG